MNADEIVRALKEMLPPQVDYAELVCSPVPSSYGVCYVWENPEPYHVSAAIDLIESLQAELTASQRRGKAAVGDKCDRFFIDDGGQCLAPSCWNENRTDYQICVKCGGDKAKCCLSDRHT